MKSKNNHGFSLIELIIAFAIFAIAGIAICSFVSFSSKSYSNNNKETKLQYEQQLAVNNIRDTLLETNRAISWNPTNNELIIFSDAPLQYEDDGVTLKPNQKPYLVSKITYKEADKQLYVKTIEMDALVSLDAVSGSFGSDLGGIIAETVTAFDVHLDKLSEGEITLDITFEIGNKKLESHPVIALRNTIVEATDGNLDEIYSGDTIEFTSTVKAVYITGQDNETGATKTFKQGEMDKIATVKDVSGKISGSKDYDAIVEAKKYFSELTSGADISQGVSWALDYDYDGHVTVDAAGTVHITGNMVGGKSDVDTAVAATGKNYVILKATSLADASKSASIKIELTDQGTYPKSITTTYDSKGTDNYLYGQKEYTLNHRIQYEGYDATSGSNPVRDTATDNSVYKLVKYSITEQGGPAEIPVGAGFSDNKYDGVFVAVKSMEGHTYTIRTTVIQRDKNGEEVYDEITLKVTNVPEKKEITVPELNAQVNATRGTECSVSVNWSQGAPKYKDNTGKEKDYYYRFVWTVDNLDNDCGKWSNRSQNKLNYFNDLIYWKKDTGTYTGNYNKTQITSDQVHRIQNLWIESKLNWKQEFTFRVKVKVQVSKDKKHWEDYDYEDSIAIKVKPVELKLTPDYQIFLYNNKPDNGIFLKADENVIGKGQWITGLTKSRQYQADAYSWGNLYTDWKNSEWVSVNKYREYHNRYHKIFRPTFTNLSVTSLNYTTNISSIKDKIDTNGDGTDDTPALQLYYLDKTTGKSKAYSESTGFEGSIKLKNNKVYFDMLLRPKYWEVTEKYSTYPSEAKFTCVVKDSYGNTVQGKFGEGNSASDFYRFIIDKNDTNYEQKETVELCNK